MPPTFDYKCLNPDCGNEYIYFHVRSDDHNECPKCGSKEAEKLVSKEPANFVLKGRGWYRDGYKGKK